MSNLFISHSSADNEAAEELRRRLEEKGHESVFLDFDPEQGIQAGTSWERTLYTKLRSCRAVVALCSDNYLASHWCFAEIALARMEGKDLFALLIDPLGADTRLPSILTEDQYIDLRAEPEAGYRRLWNGFTVKGIVPEGERQLAPGKPPYPGLRAFDEEDAPIFFGRDDEIRQGVELLNRVRRQGHPRLVMVLGSSGSGKSSLARAGIVPRLRRDSKRWLVVGPFRPGRRPLVELALALTAAFDRAGKPRSLETVLDRLRRAVPSGETGQASGDPPTAARPSAREMLREALLRMEEELSPDDVRLAESIDRLQEYLETTDETPAPEREAPGGVADDNPLAALAEELRRDSGRSEARVVLVVDQFEELLGHEENGTENPANGFLRLLKQGIEAEDDPLLALGTMRSDFLGVLQRSPSLRGVGFKSLSVGPLSPEGMLEIIERPAVLGAIDLEKPGLTNRLLRETGSADALPLLAFTLRAMWDRFGATRRFDLKGYEALGGIHGAIARVADETLEAALATSETGSRKDLRIAFLSLARPAAEGAGWARQPAAWDEMPERVRPMLQRFIDQRLLVMRADRTVEVAHEALFRSWQTLGRWLDANAEGLHLLREVRIDAEKWDGAEGEKDKKEYLWRGGRLARALELRDRGVLKLTELDTGFLEASDREERRLAAEKEARRRAELEQARALAEEQQRSARRMRRAAVVIGAFFLVALAAFFYARKKEKEAVAARLEAEDQTRIAVASEWLDRDPVRAALTLLELERPAGLPAALPLLKRALAQPLPVHELLGHTELVMTAAYSPDGERVVTASRDWTARLWTREGAPLATLSGHEGPLTTAFFSHQGDRLATAAEDATVRVWNRDGTPMRRPDGEPLVLAHDREVWDLAFSHSGRWIATASKDKKARLWRADGTGEAIVLPIHENEVNAIAFESDERLVTGAGEMVKVWRLEEDVVTLEQELADEGEVLSIAFSPVDDRFVTGTRDGTATVWSPADGSSGGAYESRVKLPHARAVRRAVFSADGAHVFTACEDRAVRRWPADGDGDGDGGPRVVFAGVVIPQWLELDPEPGADRLVAAMIDGTARIWEIDNADLDPPAKLELRGYQTNAVFSPGGDRLVVAASSDRGDVEIWIHDLAFRPSAEPPGAAAVAADESSVFRARRAGRSEPILLAGGHRRVVLHTAFSPAGDRIVTASEDGAARIWKAAESGFPALDEKGPVELTHPPDPDTGRPATINRAEFDPDGRMVVTASEDGTARLWTIDGDAVAAPAGGDVVLAHDAGVTAAAFSPDGERIVTASKDGTARVWSADGASSIVLPHRDEVLYAAFDPSGRRVVTASRDTNAWVWNADGSGEPIRLKGHEKAVDTAVFDASGRRVVTGSRDETARVWSADGRSEAMVLPRHGDWVVSAAFAPDGDRVVTTSWFGDSATWIWNVSYELLAGRARAATSLCLEPRFREKSLSEDPETARRRHARCRRCLEELPRTDRGGADPASFAAYRDCVRSPGAGG